LPDPKFVKFAGKRDYKCPKCKTATIKYAKFLGDDGKILTTDGQEPNNKFGRDSNTGWPTNLNTKQIHECIEEGNIQIGTVTISSKKIMPDESEIIDKSQLDTTPQVKELDFNDLGMGSLKKEVLQECAILWKEDEWITNYLKIKSGGESPNPAKVGMWHKLISERLRSAHESD